MVLLAILSSSACSNPELAKRRYLESGNRYFDTGKYQEAIVEYRNALKEDSKFGDARLKLAEAYGRVNEPQRAMREYVRAADLLPDRHDVQLRAGQLLLMARRFEDAKARASALLAKNPKSVDAQILFANATAGLKDLDGAIAEIEEAIELDPTRGTTYTNLAVLELARGDRDKAEAAFKKAVEIQPESVNAHLAMAHFYWSVGRSNEAEQSLKQALGLEPASPLVNRSLALFYVVSNRIAEAEGPLKAVASAIKHPVAHLALADYYAGARRFKEAREILQRLVARPDVPAQATIRLAALSYSEGRRDEAHEQLDSLLQREPKNAQALIAKARWLLADKRPDEALGRARAAVAADPRVPAGHYTLGLIQVAKNELDAATTSFNEVLRLNPRAAGARLQLSRVQLARGRLDDSVQLAEHTLKDVPGNPDARLTLIRGLIASGQRSRAETEIGSLLKQYPRAAAAHAVAGTSRLRGGNEAEARRSFERALELDANNVEALEGLIALELKAKRVSQARAMVETRLTRTPNQPAILMLTARTYAASGDLPKAEQILKKLIQVDPARIGAYAMLGAIYYAGRRLDEARVEFEQLAKRQPKSVPAHTMIAVILHGQNRLPEAKQRYRQVLDLDGRAPVAANNLAWIYAEAGVELDEALRLAQIARAALPEHPNVNDTLGWVYYRKGLPTLAVAPFEESVRREPNNPVFLYHLGLAYAGAGETDRAREILEKALTLKRDFAGADEARRTLATLPAKARG